MVVRVRIKDDWQEQRLFFSRTLICALGVALMLSAVLAQLYNLQVSNHNIYSTLSDGNRLRLESVTPTRGLVYDRNGKLLAENVSNYQLEVIPEQVEDLESTVERLAGLIDIHPADRERFVAQLKRQRRFEPVTLRFQLSDEEVARFSINRHEFPGVDIRARLTRRYPFGEEMFHVVGYLGAITEEELRDVNTARYSGTSQVGKTGIERAFEQLMHGEAGYQQVESNAQGRALRVINRTAPQRGEDIYLTIDAQLQRVAHEALGDFKGAIVAIDPNNGEILALVSKPAFDPNPFVQGLDAASFKSLSEDQRQPLFNRAIRGTYPPGSTMKPFLALAGLENGLEYENRHTICPGYFRLEGHSRPYRDWKREGHGYTELRKALRESCDVYFYELAVELGIDRIHEFLSKFGFGKPTGIDISGESNGLLPSRDWKKRARRMPWFPGDTVNIGVGQGFMLTTPLQLAQATAILANRGIVYRPHLVSSRRGATMTEPISADPQSVSQVSLRQQRYWQRIAVAMEDVLHSPLGTAHTTGQNLAYRGAGKTGTAQVFTLAEDEEYETDEIEVARRDHSLFITYAPTDAPRIALAIIVENAGGGGKVAAPIARRIMDEWILREPAT